MDCLISMAMRKLTMRELWSLEEYAKRRPQFRLDVLALKKQRTVALGEHLTFLFENSTTIRYQVQEMLRIERTFEEEGIQAELDAYNPLIPDGTNLKATLLIEYEDPVERKSALERLRGIENCISLCVGEWSVKAIADEDMERSNDLKTSAVHFLRFELPAKVIDSIKHGVSIRLDVSHPMYSACTILKEQTMHALRQDLA